MNQSTATQGLHYAVSNIDFVAPHFPHYSFSRLLAEGSMGASFKVMQTSLDREAALKVIARRIGRSQVFSEAFTQQARLSARLNHPNLVKVYDFGETDEMLYMVNEYVSGTTLGSAANGVAIDPDQVLKIMISLCNGMEHAHANGVVHGDLQPNTVLVNSEIVPKINDFGLAMSLRVQGDVLSAPLNPHFTAPEVYYGQTHGDMLTDIYSLGAIMYQLLTAISYAADVPKVSSISTCNSKFDAVIEKALNADRMQRYESVSEFLADLEMLQSQDDEVVAAAFITPLAAAKHQTVRVVQRAKFKTSPVSATSQSTSASAERPKFHFPIAG